MTLTIHVYYKGDRDCAINFAREMLESGLVAEIRNQKGNLKYEYFFQLKRGNHSPYWSVDKSRSFRWTSSIKDNAEYLRFKKKISLTDENWALYRRWFWDTRKW